MRAGVQDNAPDNTTGRRRGKAMTQLWRCDYCGEESLGHAGWKHQAGGLDFCSTQCLMQYRSLVATQSMLPPVTPMSSGPLNPDDPGGPCERCGEDNWLCAMLPDDEWRQVSGYEDGRGFLCLRCIDQLAFEKGVRYTAEIHFHGRAGGSAFYGDRDDVIQTLESLRDHYRAAFEALNPSPAPAPPTPLAASRAPNS